MLSTASSSYKGAELVHLRTVQNKYLDTFVHTLLSAVHVARVTKPDVALFFIAGNSPLCLITRWASIPAVINVDGLDSDRRKWPAFAKAYLRFAERTAPRWADEAITDSHAVADIFERRYGERIGVVPYGVEDPGYDGTDDARAAWARAAAATSCSSGGSSRRTIRTCWSRRSPASAGQPPAG